MKTGMRLTATAVKSKFEQYESSTKTFLTEVGRFA